jgi:hypothetical protein
MILFITIWSIFLTGGELFTSFQHKVVRKTGRKLTPERKKSSTTERTTPPQENIMQKNDSSAESQILKPNLEAISNALILAQTLYKHASPKINPTAETDLAPKSIATPEKVASVYLSRRNQIINAITDFDKAKNIYVLDTNKQTAFIDDINKMFQQHYTYNIQPAHIFADFISKIFATMVEPYIYAHIWSQTSELFLQQDLQRIIQQNHNIGTLLHNFLNSIVEKLEFIKKNIFIDQNKEITFSHFKKFLAGEISLPIDEWIALTKKLADNILIAIKKPEETKEPKETAATSKEETEKKNQIQQEFLKKLEQFKEEHKKTADAYIEEHAKKTTESFNQAASSIRKELKEKLEKEVKQDFETLDKREKEIKLPQELKELNDKLNIIKALLTKEKPIEKLSEMFEFLLSDFYSNFMQENETNDDTLEKGLYDINKKFDKKELHKPLYDIIIYKLNTLISLYALKHPEFFFDKEITLNLLFELPDLDEDKKLFLKTSIKQLLICNENAKFGYLSDYSLKSLANPTTFTETIVKTAQSTYKTLGNAATNLLSTLKAPGRWTMNFVNWITSENEEQKAARAKKEQERKKQRDAHDKMMKNLINLIFAQDKLDATSTDQKHAPAPASQPTQSASSTAAAAAAAPTADPSTAADHDDFMFGSAIGHDTPEPDTEDEGNDELMPGFSIGAPKSAPAANAPQPTPAQPTAKPTPAPAQPIAKRIIPELEETM